MPLAVTFPLHNRDRPGTILKSFYWEFDKRSSLKYKVLWDEETFLSYHFPEDLEMVSEPDEDLYY